MKRIAVIGIVGNSVFLPVDHFHRGGETVEASSLHFELGGKGFNQAVAASRAGADVSFLAAVGEDLAPSVRTFLSREGITPSLAEKEGQSAFAAIVTDATGANHVTVYQGVQLEAADVDGFEKSIAEADLLLLNNEVSEKVNLRALEIAHAHGVPSVLNPAPARKTDAYILENITLFTPNEHETVGLEDKSNLIVTLGGKGCLLKEENRIIPPCRAEKAVDTTGAGDTWNGVLAAMMAEGKELALAAACANRVAALGVSRAHAVSSIPTREEIKEIIQKTEEKVSCNKD